MTTARTILVPRLRVVRWFENFASRHGEPSYAVRAGRLVATAPDGASAEAALPFAEQYNGRAAPHAFAAAITKPRRGGVLLVRKGGFAVALVRDGTVAESKV